MDKRTEELILLILTRLTRMESRLVELMLHQGVNPRSSHSSPPATGG